jgi:hypothetical protein
LQAQPRLAALVSIFFFSMMILLLSKSGQRSY